MTSRIIGVEPHAAADRMKKSAILVPEARKTDLEAHELRILAKLLFKAKRCLQHSLSLYPGLLTIAGVGFLAGGALTIRALPASGE